MKDDGKYRVLTGVIRQAEGVSMTLVKVLALKAETVATNPQGTTSVTLAPGGTYDLPEADVAGYVAAGWVQVIGADDRLVDDPADDAVSEYAPDESMTRAELMLELEAAKVEFSRRANRETLAGQVESVRRAAAMPAPEAAVEAAPEGTPPVDGEAADDGADEQGAGGVPWWEAAMDEGPDELRAAINNASIGELVDYLHALGADTAEYDEDFDAVLAAAVDTLPTPA